MKQLVLFIGFMAIVSGTAAGFAHAESWESVLTCENGAVTVDVNRDERRNLQIVFRGEDMLLRLKNANMIHPNFGDREFVMRGTHAELHQVTATETEPSFLGGVFYPWDFRKMYIDMGQNAADSVERSGTSLSLKKFGIASGYSCDGYYDGDLTCHGSSLFHKTYMYQGEYVFHGCSEP